MSEPFERIQLVCTSDNEWSILSVLRNGWDSITEVYTHPLLRYFTIKEAAQLRCVCSEFVDAISIAPFERLPHIIPTRFPDWLESFPNARIGKLNFSVNKIDSAGIAALAAVLPSFTALRILNLGNNVISDVDTCILAPALPATLTHLYLYKNSHDDNIGIGTAGAAAIAAVLPRLNSLTVLNLMCNMIGDASMHAIVAVLPTTLKNLNLASIGISAAGAVALAATLPLLIRLEVFDFSHNNIGNEGITAFAAALPSLPELKRLNLRMTNRNNIYTPILAALPASITHLELGLNRITDADAMVLAGTLPDLTELTLLNLDHSSIGPAGVIALAAIFPRLPTLTYLSLFNVHIEDAGMSAIAATIPSLRAIKLLALSLHNVNTAGITALITAFPALPVLNELILSWQHFIGKIDDINALVAALPKTLTTLKWSNCINAGMVAFISRLPSMTMLKELSIIYSRMDNPIVLAAFIEALPTLVNLVHLKLHGTRIDDAAKAAIRTAAPPGCNVFV
jgi:Ran GTPase-activating protein (RanGAP) involved in mRNA processing and transport